MSENRSLDNTFTFKDYQRLEVNKTINGNFYQFCYRMNVEDNRMIYSTHNPNAGKDWAKKYHWLEIYSNNPNPFYNLPPDFKENNNYYWDLGISYCVCPYSRRQSCSEHNTDWKETQGDKLIYYEGKTGSITLNPLSLFYDGTGYFKPISAKWKDKANTFKLKIEPAENLTDDCEAINQIEFVGGEFFSSQFRQVINDIIEKGSNISLWFNKNKPSCRGNHGYIKRGKTGNKVVWLTPFDLNGWEEGKFDFVFEDYNKWLKIDNNNRDSYDNWTKEQLITEINKLKAEIEGLKNNKILSVCSKQTKLNQKQAKLEKMEKYFYDNNANETNSNNADYLPYMLGGIVVLVVGVVIGLLVRNRVKKSKLKR